MELTVPPARVFFLGGVDSQSTRRRYLVARRVLEKGLKTVWCRCSTASSVVRVSETTSDGWQAGGVGGGWRVAGAGDGHAMLEMLHAASTNELNCCVVTVTEIGSVHRSTHRSV